MAIILDGTTGEQLAGNLTFTGTAPRITGDFSNATLANRVNFQSSTTNGNTLVGALPNGTSTVSSFSAFNNTDPTNAGYVQIRIDSGAANINSASSGTGTNLPMTFGVGGSNQMAIATDGTITGTKGNLQLISGTAVASTSGTSIDFTGIPSWAKRITVILNGVSLSGSAYYLLQLGSGSPTTSGYVGSGGYGYQSGSTVAVNTTNGFNIQVAGATPANTTTHGTIVFTQVSGNTWIASGNGGYSATAFWSNGGSVTLGGTLDRVRITTSNGTDTFDAGSINIMYE